MLVDINGLILKVYVTAANLNDREGLRGILDQSRDCLFPGIKKIWTDAGYTAKEVVEEIGIKVGINLEITKRNQQKLEVIPRRRVVERSIAWINRYRRLSKDYEYRTTTIETMVYMTGIRLMLKRFAKHDQAL